MSAHPEVEILLVEDDANDVEPSYRMGANSYIVKPLGFEAFARAVSRVGLYWLLLNEQPH